MTPLSDRSLRLQRLLQRTRYRPAHDDDLRRALQITASLIVTTSSP
jgi:hypothetical protein